MSLGRRSVEGVGLPVVGVAVVALAFELAPRLGVVPRASFPPTSEVAATLVRLPGTAEPWAALGHTLDAWARGRGGGRTRAPARWCESPPERPPEPEAYEPEQGTVRGSVEAADGSAVARAEVAVTAAGSREALGEATSDPRRACSLSRSATTTARWSCRPRDQGRRRRDRRHW